MTRKKKEAVKPTISAIYDEEPLEHKVFNAKAPEPRAFKADGEWHCGRESCICDNALLFDLGDGRFKCGHCLYAYYL